MDDATWDRRRRAALAVCALAALITWTLSARIDSLEGAARDEVIDSGGRRVVATVLTPPGPTTSGVVLCHGVTANRESMAPLARELARRGQVVVTFDYGAHGDSDARPGREESNVEDVRAALALLRRAGASGRAAIVGHSMGVTSAVAVASEDSSVVAVVALGQRAVVGTERPPRLLLAAGAQDAFHPLSAYRETLAGCELASGAQAAPFDTLVVPATGAVRRLAMSGACEHAGEVHDAALLGEVVTFVDDALAPRATTPSGERAPAAWRPGLGSILRALAALAIACAAAVVASARSPVDRRRSATLGWLALLAPPIAVVAGALSLTTARLLVPSLLLGLTAGHAVALRRAAGPLRARSALLVAACPPVAWLVGSALGALPSYAAAPRLLGDLPLFLLGEGLLLRALFSLEALGPRLLDALGHPTLLLVAVALTEILLPGRVALAIASFVARACRACGGPDLGPEPAAATREHGARSRAPVLVLTVLVLAALALFARRASEGLLDQAGALATVAGAALRMAVLPAVCFVVASRVARRLV